MRSHPQEDHLFRWPLQLEAVGEGKTLAIISTSPSSVFDPERVGIDTVSVTFEL